MIVYHETKRQFVDDVFNDCIEEKLLDKYRSEIGNVSVSEIRSWRNSLQYMERIVNKPDIPNDASVALEFKIPLTSKRIDFIIAGSNEENEDQVVIVELKQWSEASKTELDAVVNTFVGGANRNLVHPSYQAYSYSMLIKNYNQEFERNEIGLVPCAYVHNMSVEMAAESLLDDRYKDYIDDAPVFVKGEAKKLYEFIKKYIKHGDGSGIMHKIEFGKIRPSKSLADSLSSMLKGNDEFVMIDDQKVIFELIMDIANELHSKDKKQVLIIEGGPGTGKSVVAVNLLVKLIEKRLNSMYVTKNSAPRNIYSTLLKKDFKKSYIDNLFKGSGAFTETEENYFDVLIVDEAHRLNEKSGLFSNKGKNQIKELIHSSRLSIFFLDEAQIVTMKDIGTKDEVLKWANIYEADIFETKLLSQFRCNGSDGYISWLDNVLQIKETANDDINDLDFEFKVFDDPNKLRDEILGRNLERNRARILAGYCWEWPKEGRANTEYHDIVIKESDFSMSWNLNNTTTFIIDEQSVNEVGCIHTSQGLELDYVGVIIGNDLRFEDGKVITDVAKRAKSDQSVKGWKKGMKNNPIETQLKVDKIIRNTYKTLLTRGMKGCFIFCENPELNEYFKNKVNS